MYRHFLSEHDSKFLCVDRYVSSLMLGSTDPACCSKRHPMHIGEVISMLCNNPRSHPRVLTPMPMLTRLLSSWNHHDPQTSSLCDHALTQPLQTQTTQSHLTLFNPRNLIHMLQAHSPDVSNPRIPCRRRCRTCLAMCTLPIVLRAGHIACSPNSILFYGSTSRSEEEGSCGGCS